VNKFKRAHGVQRLGQGGRLLADSKNSSGAPRTPPSRPRNASYACSAVRVLGRGNLATGMQAASKRVGQSCPSPFKQPAKMHQRPATTIPLPRNTSERSCDKRAKRARQCTG